MELLPKIPTDTSLRLNVFCTRDQDAWRLYVEPGQCPRVLQPLLDRHWEAYPLLLDFDDLDRYLAAQGASVEKRWSRSGSVELSAQGASAITLANWLAAAAASGIR